MFEWLLHHQLEGVTQFVLLDQDSSDGGGEIARKFATRPGSRAGYGLGTGSKSGSSGSASARCDVTVIDAPRRINCDTRCQLVDQANY